MNRTSTTILQKYHKLSANIIAFFLAVIGFIASALVTQNVFEAIPHIEDEVAYVWQARALADGHLKLPSPPHPKSYLVPFVVDLHGERFGKYPPGWPAMLAVAIQLGLRAWINPLLAGLGVWLTYLLGKRFFSFPVALLAAGLTATSPFFLVNSGSLLSHPLGLVLSALFALTWLEAFWAKASDQGAENPDNTLHRQWGLTILSAVALGFFILTRPMTALAVAIPFAMHGLFLLWHGNKVVRLRLVIFGLVVLFFVGMYLLWQYVLTGNALLNPYTLWWPYDKVGFGPGHGRIPNGHNINQAWVNTRQNLQAGSSDLFGWSKYSWVFLPFGVWAARRNGKGLLLGSVVISIVLVYMAYWIGATLFGPRYYYEGLFSLTLISSAGIAWLAGWPVKPGEPFVRYPGRRKLRLLATLLALGILVGINLTLYLPNRLDSMVGLYDIERSDQLPFETKEAQSYTPALVIVHTDRWMEYGALIDLENPQLTSPFIFAWSMSAPVDASLAADFPGRTLYHYYPERPFRLYPEPLTNP